MKTVRVRFYEDDIVMRVPIDHLRNILVSVDGDAYLDYKEEDSEPIRIMGTYETILKQIEIAERE